MDGATGSTWAARGYGRHAQYVSLLSRLMRRVTNGRIRAVYGARHSRTQARQANNRRTWAQRMRRRSTISVASCSEQQTEVFGTNTEQGSQGRRQERADDLRAHAHIRRSSMTRSVRGTIWDGSSCARQGSRGSAVNSSQSGASQQKATRAAPAAVMHDTESAHSATIPTAHLRHACALLLTR